MVKWLKRLQLHAMPRQEIAMYDAKVCHTGGFDLACMTPTYQTVQWENRHEFTNTVLHLVLQLGSASLSPLQASPSPAPPRGRSKRTRFTGSRSSTSVHADRLLDDAWFCACRRPPLPPLPALSASPAAPSAGAAAASMALRLAACLAPPAQRRPERSLLLRDSGSLQKPTEAALPSALCINVGRAASKGAVHAFPDAAGASGHKGRSCGPLDWHREQQELSQADVGTGHAARPCKAPHRA